MACADDTIVITGAAGFIGSCLAESLNKLGYRNLILTDRLDTSEKWRNLRGIEFEDYLDADDFLKLVRSNKLNDVTAVFHMGACSSTTETDSSFLMENNYHYTKELATWCCQHSLRFITASSAATYGDGTQGYSDDQAMITKYRPLNMYGFSKHLFDKWALAHGLYNSIVGLKFFNVYGPHEDHKGSMTSLVRKSFDLVNTRGYIELFKSYRPDYEDGKQMRDFVYVDDVVQVMLFFYEHPELGGLYNCGSGTPRTWIDLAKAVFVAMNKTEDIRFVEMPEYLKAKYQYYTKADISKLRAVGYTRPFTSIEEGVRLYINDYLLK